jgi:SAM-dependent methyltransferase
MDLQFGSKCGEGTLNVNERRPYCQCGGTFLKRSLVTATTIACSLSILSISACLADGAIPKPAPDFHLKQSEERPASGGADENPIFTKKASFNVVPRAENQSSYAEAARSKRAPLSGEVSRADDAVQNNQLRGNVGSLIDTPPVISAAVSKTVPPEMFKAWLDKAHPGVLLSVNGSPGRVIVVKGRWDDSGRTLRALGIQYERVGSGDLEDMPFDNVKVLVVDCAGSAPRESLQRIRDFVARGGYLLATDWALDNLIEKAFPGYVEYDRKKNAEAIYDAYVVNPDPVLFANAVTNAHWKMDEASHLLRVVKPGSVRVLARSRKLEKEDPGSQGVLAVAFPFGKGYVMHMVGHFDNNGFFKFTNALPDPAPAIGISLRQALAANFVVAGLTGTKIP